MQKRRLQALGQRGSVLDTWRTTLWPGGGDDAAGSIDDKQLGKVFGLRQLIPQQRAVGLSEPLRELFR
ncbi:hypothetical protein D3C72_2069770 [compost metagenome]